MKTKKVVRKIFDTLNYSKKMKISSILPDRDSDYAILLELEDGSKFEIIIIPTNYSKKLKISSILPDRDSDYAILLELEDGSKFEIIIIPTKLQ